MATKVVLITGCSTGIGHAAARAFLAAGYITVATARRLDAISDLAEAGCMTLQLDVTDSTSCREATNAVLADHGRIDVLVNNAGFSAMGAVEDVTIDEWRAQFETNLFGVVQLVQLVLPHMRRRGSGRIINVGSMGGRVTFPGGGAYHASKYALEAMTDALRFESARHGVQVVLVEPGSVATALADNAGLLVLRYPDSAHQHLNAQMDSKFSTLTRGGASPNKLARVLVRAATARWPRPRYLVGADARTVVPLHQLLPTQVWDAVLRHAFRGPSDRVTPLAQAGHSRDRS